MSNDSNFKVRDSRLFNNDGSLREDSQKHAEPAPNTAAETASPSKKTTPPDTTDLSIDFQTFVLSLASSVQISLGLIANPMTGQTEADFNHARQTIDILTLLERKTEGNLSPEESGLLKHMLFQLRMAYVDLSKNAGVKTS